MPVTRFEISELIGDQFVTPSSRDELISVARRRGARGAVLVVLRRLTDRSYRGLWDVWLEAPVLLDSFDPWESDAAPG
jgi:hypothetical protein